MEVINLDIRSKITKSFRNNFISGALVLIPVTIIVWLSVFLLNILGGVRNILPNSISDSSNYLVRLSSSLFVLIFIVLFVTIVGWLSRKIIGKQLIKFVEEAIAKIPVLRSAYKAIKQLIDIFSGKSDQFKAVCLVEFPRKGVLTYGFITGETILAEKKYYYVFVSFTPPTSGFTILVEQTDVIRVDTSVEEAFKTILSMGVLSSKTNIQSNDKK